MRWSLLLAVLGLSITDVASFAQRPPEGQRLSSTRSNSHNAGFFDSAGVVKFHMVQGRLCLDPPRHRKGSQKSDRGAVYESITVTAERGIPSMHYVCQTSEHHLTLSVQQANSVRIESWIPSLAQRAVLLQPEFGTVTLSLTRGDLTDNYEGPTLLHVRQSDDTSFDLHFTELMQRLLRGQSLERLSADTQHAMLGQLEKSRVPSAAQIESLVAQLRSRRRAKRMAAERQLLAWGTPVIPTLRLSLGGDLDTEQRVRIQGILRRLRPRVHDTPASLAKLLINDESYWSRIADRLNPDQLQLANGHLVRYGASPIEIQTQPARRIAAKP